MVVKKVLQKEVDLRTVVVETEEMTDAVAVEQVEIEEVVAVVVEQQEQVEEDN